VLSTLIDAYIRKHGKLRRPAGAYEGFLAQETEQQHTRLLQTEQALKEAKAKIGVVSLEDAKKGYSDEISKIRAELFRVEADLAEAQAMVDKISAFSPLRPLTANVPTAATNQAPLPVEKLDEYKKVCGILDALAKREQELSVMFTGENSLVKDVRNQIATYTKQRKRLVEETPGLLAVSVAEPKSLAADPTAGGEKDLASAMARTAALEAKKRRLTDELFEVRKEVAALDEAEASIVELQRNKELLEQHYKALAVGQEQNRIDEKLGGGKEANIGIVQAPSPPSRVTSKIRKMMASVFFGCVGAGLGLAFLIEMYLDRSIKRPVEVETRLGLPLFINIPRHNLGCSSNELGARKKQALLAEKNPGGNSKHSNGSLAGEPSGRSPGAAQLRSAQSGTPANLEIAPWDPSHVLRPFYETLRDRLITYFEAKNLTHKPKLVAVTACAEGSGVSTVAAGLAASLSETGEGNVLLVDMNQRHGAAHHFCKGDLACDLEDALKMETRSNALVYDNLYVVAETQKADNLPRLLPQRFRNLIPRLKASDYDYIIFDMPPVSQISLTPRLAKFMDTVLMVVESEKTDRDVVKRATTWLTEANPNVGIVLNKSRNYVPKRLQQEM
jgi:Mrp family chromosome partitioning ATPase